MVRAAADIVGAELSDTGAWSWGSCRQNAGLLARGGAARLHALWGRSCTLGDVIADANLKTHWSSDAATRPRLCGSELSSQPSEAANRRGELVYSDIVIARQPKKSEPLADSSFHLRPGNLKRLVGAQGFEPWTR
jgi:hypothetical protein